MNTPEKQKISKELSSIFGQFFNKDENIIKILEDKILNQLYYTPKIGVMGKSGAGKSSLINAIVGRKICETSDSKACTREKEEIRVSISENKEVIFIDLPGIAENSERDKEYKDLYKNTIPNLDIILWVIKVDDRANKSDEEFYKWLIQHYKQEQIIFVISQVDKTAPCKDWNYEKYTPSERQRQNIENNCLRIATNFGISPNHIVDVACDYDEGKLSRYHIDKLVTHIIYQIPNKAKTSFLTSVDKENRTEESKEEAKESIFKSLLPIFASSPILELIINTGKKIISKGLEKIFDYFDKK